MIYLLYPIAFPFFLLGIIFGFAQRFFEAGYYWAYNKFNTP